MSIIANDDLINQFGLSGENILEAVNETHHFLSEIDGKLKSIGAGRISEVLELANLSSVIGNIFGASIAKYSRGVFMRNGPHKYPDLLSQQMVFEDIEIKIALEKNKPKGHLPKPGVYMIARYVLVFDGQSFIQNSRGSTPKIWEVRLGRLAMEHFNLSNTAGDSGKTAVINKTGMESLAPVYVDLENCPYSKTSPTFQTYNNLVNNT